MALVEPCVVVVRCKTLLVRRACRYVHELAIKPLRLDAQCVCVCACVRVCVSVCVTDCVCCPVFVWVSMCSFFS